MKEIRVIIGIILIIIGTVFFEMNVGILIAVFGLVLLTAGVFFYVKTVDSLDERLKKDEENEGCFTLNPS